MAFFTIFYKLFLINSLVSRYSTILCHRCVLHKEKGNKLTLMLKIENKSILAHCLSGVNFNDEAKLCYYHYDEVALLERITEYPIHPMILGRRSHFKQTGDPMTDAELFPLLEAMRWGPSNYNIQPWRVVYAHHGTPRFQEFFNFTAPRNRIWCESSSVLMVVVTDMWSRHYGTEKYIFTQGFSTGAAIANILFEGTARGYFVHIMHGYDREKLGKVLGIDGNPHFRIEVMLAIGKRDPAYMLQGPRKDITTKRKKLSDIISEDVFKWGYLSDQGVYLV